MHEDDAAERAWCVPGMRLPLEGTLLEKLRKIEAQFVDDGFTELLSSRAANFGGVAGEGGLAPDLEQRSHEAQAVACDGVAEARSFDEAAACVRQARNVAEGYYVAEGRFLPLVALTD